MKCYILLFGTALFFSKMLCYSSALIPSVAPQCEKYNKVPSNLKQEMRENILLMKCQNDDHIFTLPEKEFTSYQNFQERKRDWINRSMQYYSTVMREKHPNSSGEILSESLGGKGIDTHNQKINLATKHYFALCLIKSGKLNHAEKIYRQKIDELMSEEDGSCNNAQLAVSTLLLALLLQRMGDIKGTRSVFLNFFRTVVVKNSDEDIECACSAKVLQAYALFELRRGHAKKSLEIVREAVKMDRELAPVLKWKQFRDIMKALSLASS